MAADLLAKGGDRPSARRMWQQMYEQAEAGIIKENARVRLQILDSLDAADAPGGPGDGVRGRVSAGCPRGSRSCAPRGCGAARSTDAAGVPFGYDGTSGKVIDLTAVADVAAGVSAGGMKE